MSKACVELSSFGGSARLAALVPELGDDAGIIARIAPQPGCNWRLRFVETQPIQEAEGRERWQHLSGAADRFALTVDGVAPHLLLHAESELAAAFALRRAFALLMLRGGGYFARGASIVDAPAIRRRGVVEGFYGPAYAEAQRANLMRHMGRLLLDTYVYGPKGDEFAFGQWATPYPAGRAQAIRAAADYARRHFLDFVWAMAPAWPPLDTSVRFSSDEDLRRVGAKLDSLRTLGVDRFAIFLDDIQDGLHWPEDRARFGSVAEAHGFFLNRVLGLVQAADPGARLLVVGTHYSRSTTGWEAYNRVLGQRLAPGIDVLWTGDKVYSPTIQGADVAPINQLLGRKVVLWDNMPEALEPISGRTPDLVEHVAGYLFNPVVHEWRHYRFDEYLRMLGPQADLLWNPAAYAPGASWAAWDPLR